MPSPVDRLHAENEALLKYLAERSETSFGIAFADQARKVLLLAAASYLEHCVLDIVMRCVERRTNSDVLVLSFVKTKAIGRQYHTFFNWEGNNANQFFGLFGKDFRDTMTDAVKGNEPLDGAIKAFLQIGRLRNEMVHGNFISYPLESTATEIFSLFEQAQEFIKELESRLVAEAVG